MSVKPTYSTQPKGKLVWANALAYYTAEVNNKERFMHHFFITYVMTKSASVLIPAMFMAGIILATYSRAYLSHSTRRKTCLSKTH
jgi:hypothetical protein